MIITFSMLTVTAKGINWITDFKVATNAAAANKLPIIAYFSVSDTSEECMRFDFLVLQDPEFNKYVHNNFIMFWADLPRLRQLPDDIRKQNTDLIKRYGINRYPTIILLNPKGIKLATINYDGKSTALHFISTLRKALGQ